MHTNRAILAVTILVLGTAFWTGCQSFDWRRRIPWKTGTEPQKGAAQKMVNTWIDAVHHQPGRPPIRGFGGRVFFYGKDEDKSVEVDGRIVVYAFDETGRDASHAVPDRKYVFPAEQVAELCSESSVGPAYSVWIPWDEVGGQQKRISLLARFEPTEGPVIVGTQITTVLPGTEPAAQESTEGNRTEPAVDVSAPGAGADQSVQPASFTQAGVTGEIVPRMTTTTIPLSTRSRRPAATARPVQPTGGAERGLTGTVPGSARGLLLPDPGFRQAACLPLSSAPSEEPTASGTQGTQVRQVTTDRPAPFDSRTQRPRAAHFAPEKHPVPAEQVFRPGFGRARWQPPREASRCGSPIQPQPRFPVGTVDFAPTVPSDPR